MYPNDLIPKADFVNKGGVAPTESHTIPSGPSPKIILKYIPQGRTVNEAGIVIPSSISIKSVGGNIFTEVFDMVSLVAKTFYADPLSKTIYFSSADSGTVISVDYLTRGDIIDASIVNTIQNHLRSVECIQIGRVQLNVNGSAEVDFSSKIDAEIADMYVIAITSNNKVPTYTVNASEKKVIFTGDPSENVSYVIYLVLE